MGKKHLMKNAISEINNNVICLIMKLKLSCHSVNIADLTSTRLLYKDGGEN